MCLCRREKADDRLVREQLWCWMRSEVWHFNMKHINDIPLKTGGKRCCFCIVLITHDLIAMWHLQTAARFCIHPAKGNTTAGLFFHLPYTTPAWVFNLHCSLLLSSVPLSSCTSYRFVLFFHDAETYSITQLPYSTIPVLSTSMYAHTCTYMFIFLVYSFSAILKQT